jgi:hypothetical protein
MDTNEWCAIAHIDFRPSFADRGALSPLCGRARVPASRRASRSSASSSPPDMIQQAVYKFLAEATGLRRLHASDLPLASKTNFMRETISERLQLTSAFMAGDAQLMRH